MAHTEADGLRPTRCHAFAGVFTHPHRDLCPDEGRDLGRRRLRQLESATASRWWPGAALWGTGGLWLVPRDRPSRVRRRYLKAPGGVLPALPRAHRRGREEPSVTSRWPGCSSRSFCCLVAFELLWRLAVPDRDERERSRAVRLSRALPDGCLPRCRLHRVAVPDALALAAFFLAERDHWAVGSNRRAGGVALLTRSVGLPAVVVGLAVMAWPRGSSDSTWLLLAPAMFAVYPIVAALPGPRRPGRSSTRRPQMNQAPLTPWTARRASGTASRRSGTEARAIQPGRYYLFVQHRGPCLPGGRSRPCYPSSGAASARPTS